MTEKTATKDDLTLIRPLEVTRRTSRYWVGVRPDPHPPVVAAVIGRVTFQEVYEPWEGTNRAGEQIRGRYYGLLIDLSAEQVAFLRHRMRHTVVRWESKRPPNIYGKLIGFQSEEDIQQAVRDGKLADDPLKISAYRAKVGVQNLRDGDEPIAKYLYVVKTPVRLDTIPPCVLETGIPDPD